MQNHLPPGTAVRVGSKDHAYSLVACIPAPSRSREGAREAAAGFAAVGGGSLHFREEMDFLGVS